MLSSTMNRVYGSLKYSLSNKLILSRSLFSSDIYKILVPSMGDSITEGTVGGWTKKIGEHVNVDDVVVVLETDKVSVDVRAQQAGELTEQTASKGANVPIGAVLGSIKVGATGSKTATPEKVTAPVSSPTPTAASKPAAPVASTLVPSPSKTAAPSPKPAAVTVPFVAGSRAERRIPMSRLRQTVARRLKDSQNTNASLTTFNEIDMTNATALRNKYKDEFEKKHGAKLGFMSFFLKAATHALQEFPAVNGVIDNNEIVMRDYVDISVAVSTPTGLVVPVIRNCESLSHADFEKTLVALGKKARDGQIGIEDMVGGTFTISNGGVFGSMMGTPIINPPQSAILGMHGIFPRPVAINGQVEIRNMMYVALTYDHRIIDGREAVLFLKKVKEIVEDPAKGLLQL